MAKNTLKKRLRRVERRVQQNQRLQGALQRLYSRYVDFCARTIRWERIGLGSYEADIARGVPRILVLWHERLVMTPYIRENGWLDHGMAAIASRHADARIMTAHLDRLGISVIEVGTSEVNTGAVRAAVKWLRSGRSLSITVDGPMGPPRKAKAGALVIGGLARVQVVPCSFAVSRGLRLRTWDRMVFPLPWTRGVLALGDGFVPEPRMSGQDIEAAVERMATMIDALTDACETRLTRR